MRSLPFALPHELLFLLCGYSFGCNGCLNFLFICYFFGLILGGGGGRGYGPFEARGSTPTRLGASVTGPDFGPRRGRRGEPTAVQRLGAAEAVSLLGATLGGIEGGRSHARIPVSVAIGT
jgi:hypothetical protein